MLCYHRSIICLKLHATLIFSEDGSVTTYFQNSPPISTYLVAFVVSEFPHLTGNISRPILQRVYARTTAMNQSDLIFELSEPMLDKMIEYFRVDYPLPKLDLIALPGFNTTFSVVVLNLILIRF